ncbi:hypothetical protein GWO43_13020, partial [candidate division KSB1 bacterium]|nr:hypothetical protein [candidate division KSB1 bacterium]NIW94944.1 hypothetical protein [Phycisphaerae bacterium]NIS24878.1 hypothetical protein [candidate division KSB1 bacterium]NIT71778.1 hypothetical protein [candidate division KSB1 bacterium]NIU25518.1 hypothetical protein [candidate division KSB1 bacterium]
CNDIGVMLGCSDRKVDYWLKKHGISKRSISEAIYAKANPGGDPFTIQDPKTIDQAILFGIGVGLYWGEGNKRNKHSVRLGNTDPKLIKKFIEFLKVAYCVDVKRLKFGLQVFSDMSPRHAQTFWEKELGISSNQFQKVVVTPARGVGNYRNKTQYGVLTVYLNNKKLRDVICTTIENL